MNQEHQWTLPTKRKGESLRSINIKVSADLVNALDSLSVSESKRIHRAVSRGTILSEFASKDTKFHRDKKAELKQLIKQYKRGKQDESTTIHKDTDNPAN